MKRFDRFIGIDYSGASTPQRPLPGIRVFESSRREPPHAVSPPEGETSRSRHWSRSGVAAYLQELISTEQRCLIGIDHALSFPANYFHRYQLNSWIEFLADFVKEWPTHRAGAKVEDFRAGSARSGDSRDLRITDRWTAGAKSVFQFDVQGSVAKSTHAGLPFIHQLKCANGQRLHAWPFDGWQPPDNASVIVEVFPSLARRRFDREDRTVDEQDAYAVSRWMSAMDDRGRLNDFFNPPLLPEEQEIALLEGWIFGVL